MVPTRGMRLGSTGGKFALVLLQLDALSARPTYTVDCLLLTDIHVRSAVTCIRDAIDRHSNQFKGLSYE